MEHTHLHGDFGAIAAPDGKRVNRAFKLGIALNLAYVVVEATAGFMADSMGLLSDAGHNLSDVAALLIALIAFKMAQKSPTERYTFGYGKATIQASVLNAIILYLAVILIMAESIRKLLHPVAVDGVMVAWVAGVGVFVNGLTAWLFIKDSRRDLNIKGVFLHMAADTLVSLGVVAGGIVIHFTGRTLIDPIMGITLAIIIAAGSYSMLADSLRMVLDGVPKNVDIKQVERIITSVPGVVGYHHLHVWPLSTTSTAMTVHVVVKDLSMVDDVITRLRDAVRRAGIAHTTIEAESHPCPESEERKIINHYIINT